MFSLSTSTGSCRDHKAFLVSTLHTPPASENCGADQLPHSRNDGRCLELRAISFSTNALKADRWVCGRVLLSLLDKFGKEDESRLEGKEEEGGAASVNCAKTF